MLALRIMQGECALAGVAIKSANRPQRCETADRDTEQAIERAASIRYVRAGDDTPLFPVPVLDKGDQVQTVGRVCLPNRPDIARPDGGHGSQPVQERAGVGYGNHAPGLPVPVEGQRLQE